MAIRDQVLNPNPEFMNSYPLGPNLETVSEYLKGDRQWPRYLRISHAKLQLSRSGMKEESDFWQAVLKANLRY